MSDRNGFFKIIDGSSIVSMKYYPSKGNGEALKIDEVLEFLEKVGIKNYDLIKVNGLIAGNIESEEVISNDGCYRFDESMDVKVTADKMYAIARFYPSSSNGSRMNKNEIIKTLEFGKIKFGIIEKAIDSFIENPEYCKNIIVAMGTKAIDGKDASIKYKFQTDKKAKPQLKEDGTVDFHNLNNISHIKSGDILAELEREDPGVPGTDVYGNIIKPKRITRLVLKYGKNIRVTDDGLKLISEVDGHATLEGDKVFVSNDYDVPADVDNSTGDINYNGSITIKGNVRTGFSVVSEGNVEVFGVVEGATIISGGDIVIHRGIQGMGKSKIVAKGNIISKFIESADIQVDGYVETDTILNSNVSAKGDIYVRGRNGSLIGGNVRSVSLIEAAVIGSPMGTSTSVEVGMDPSIRDRIKVLNDTISMKTQENDKLQQILTVMRKKKDAGMLEAEKIPMLSQLTKSIVLNNSEIKDCADELKKTENLLTSNENARVRATKSIYPGTKITISGDFIYIHSEVSRCQYVRQKSEIKSKPL